MDIRDILNGKSTEVFTLPLGATGRDALHELNRLRIGALVVVDPDGAIAGIVSERDILRRMEERSLDEPVSEFMTHKRKLIIVDADDSIEHAMAMFTDHKIRHLPVMEKERLVGVVSIGDAVKSLLSIAEYEKKALMDYITGSYAV